MQNKILLALLFISLLTAVALSKETATKAAPLLSEADRLKHAEKYQEAEKLYDQVLEIAPSNPEALKGKDDCRIMLSPMILIQHLAPPFTDPEYRELIKKHEEAKTPWDKRRAEIAVERYAVRYTGRVFAESAALAEEEADRIIRQAILQAEMRGFSKTTYLEAERKLLEFQENLHRRWKGYGPEILDSALKKLKKKMKGPGLGSDLE